MRWILLLVGAATTAAIEAHELRTRFTFRHPTNENILGILFGCENLHKLPEKEVKFNHDSVGITFPNIYNSTGESQHVAFPLCSGYPLESKLDRFRRSSSSTKDNISCSSINYKGWRILRFQKRVGHGKQCYKRIQCAIFNWDFISRYGKKSMGILAPNTPVHLAKVNQSFSTTISRRGLLGTMSEIPLFKPLFVVNPIHVIYDIKDCQKCVPKSIVSSSSYATLDGHLLTGEERVSVILRGDNAVDVEIVSFSRSAPSISGRIVWPFIGRLQKQFFLKEMEHLSSVAESK